jgi:hypothetical protein
VGSEPGSSRFHLFSHFSPLYRTATAAPQLLVTVLVLDGNVAIDVVARKRKWQPSLI